MDSSFFLISAILCDSAREKICLSQRALRNAEGGRIVSGEN